MPGLTNVVELDLGQNHTCARLSDRTLRCWGLNGNGQLGNGTLTNSTTEVAGLFQKGYWLYDARIVYELPGKHFALGLYGQNLTKKAYKTDAQEFSSVGSIRTVYYGAPRTVMLKLTARY